MSVITPIEPTPAKTAEEARDAYLALAASIERTGRDRARVEIWEPLESYRFAHLTKSPDVVLRGDHIDVAGIIGKVLDIDEELSRDPTKPMHLTVKIFPVIGALQAAMYLGHACVRSGRKHFDDVTEAELAAARTSPEAAKFEARLQAATIDPKIIRRVELLSDFFCDPR
ncbi:MAG: hypothetical protein AB1515_02480 [Nitrospirota bacterium]